MKATFLVFINVQVLFSQNLFFSEYAEGSSNNKYLEIFNGGVESISLADYQLINCRNGCTSWEHSHLLSENNTLPPSSVWVFCSSGSISEILSECDQTIANNSIFNGDDVWALQQISTSTILDIIGVVGDDPGTGWEVAGVNNATKDHTLIRKESIANGIGENWAQAAGTTADNSQWTVNDKDDFSGIGSHTCSACTGSIPVCSDTSACNYSESGDCTYPQQGFCDCSNNVSDCSGTCGGIAIEDNCGVCDTDPTNDCIQDCLGIWGGNAAVDACGVCDGPGAVLECGCTSIPEGYCDCNENTLDCNGDCGGTAMQDECGVCNGPGAIYTCGCTEIPEDECDCNRNSLDACGECGGVIQNPDDCSLFNDVEYLMEYIVINAYPNPFNNHINLMLSCNQCSPEKIEILSAQGSSIETLTVNESPPASRHYFQWKADNSHSGIYFVKVSTPTETMMKKITLLK